MQSQCSMGYRIPCVRWTYSIENWQNTAFRDPKNAGTHELNTILKGKSNVAKFKSLYRVKTCRKKKYSESEDIKNSLNSTLSIINDGLNDGLHNFN